jgi:hypothetical protein
MLVDAASAYDMGLSRGAGPIMTRTSFGAYWLMPSPALPVDCSPAAFCAAMSCPSFRSARSPNRGFVVTAPIASCCYYIRTQRRLVKRIHSAIYQNSYALGIIVARKRLCYVPSFPKKGKRDEDFFISLIHRGNLISYGL